MSSPREITWLYWAFNFCLKRLLWANLKRATFLGFPGHFLFLKKGIFCRDFWAPIDLWVFFFGTQNSQFSGFLGVKFLAILPCLCLLWQFFGLLRYVWLHIIGIECIRGLFDVASNGLCAGICRAILRYMSNSSWQLGGTISYHRLSHRDRSR